MWQELPWEVLLTWYVGFFSQIFCLINLGWRLCLCVRRIKRLFNSHDVVVDIGNLVACKALFACGENMENSVHMSD